MGVKVRLAAKADVNKIFRIGRSYSDFVVSQRIRFYERSEVGAWSRDHKNGIFLVAIERRRVLGFVFCKIMSHHWAIIDNFFVLPERRNQGIGTRLIQECLIRLARRGINYVSALVRVDRKKVRAYMSTVGFEETSRYVWVERFSKDSSVDFGRIRHNSRLL